MNAYNGEKETQQTHLSSDHTLTIYNLSVSGQGFQILPIDYFSNVTYHKFMIDSSQKMLYKPSPIQEIDLEEWKQSLNYDNTKIDNLLTRLLLDYGLEPSRENMDWIKKDALELISQYEKKYDVQLEEDMRATLQKLAIRVAYDRICMNNGI